MEDTGMRELRCNNADCNPRKKDKPHLLGKALMMPGSVVQIKCHNCGTITEFKSTLELEQTIQ